MRFVVLVALGLVAVCAPARAGSDTQAAAHTPILSGSYVYNWMESCSANPSPTFNSGVVTFRAGKKTATINAYKTSGSMSFTLSPLTGSQPYSNTSTTFTLNAGTANAQTFQATYGAVIGGVANSLSWIGVTQNLSCEDMAWLTRQ